MHEPSGRAQLVGDRELTIARVLDAPRELVWKVWTSQEHIERWWGPKGFTTTTHQMEVKVGGMWRFVMHGPDGRDYQNRIMFREVVEPERLAYEHRGVDESDTVHFTVTVTFEEEGGGTKMTMRSVFPSGAAREHGIRKYGAQDGLTETTDRLTRYLAGMQ
jgi:uncharacterized protein YndB with AHSA1/START domain